MAHRYEAPQPYEDLEHTGDAGIRVTGANPEEALARLVLAFGELLSGGAGVEARGTATVSAEPGDPDLMAVDVLRELLFAFGQDGSIPVTCEVELLDRETGARVRVGVGTYDAERHGEGIDIKAVTLHRARFEPDDSGWAAQVIFDL